MRFFFPPEDLDERPEERELDEERDDFELRALLDFLDETLDEDRDALPLLADELRFESVGVEREDNEGVERLSVGVERDVTEREVDEELDELGLRPRLVWKTEEEEEAPESPMEIVGCGSEMLVRRVP